MPTKGEPKTQEEQSRSHPHDIAKKRQNIIQVQIPESAIRHRKSNPHGFDSIHIRIKEVGSTRPVMLLMRVELESLNYDEIVPEDQETIIQFVGPHRGRKLVIGVWQGQMEEMHEKQPQLCLLRRTLYRRISMESLEQKNQRRGRTFDTRESKHLLDAMGINTGCLYHALGLGGSGLTELPRGCDHRKDKRMKQLIEGTDSANHEFDGRMYIWT